MTKAQIKILVLLMVGVAMAMQVSGCKRRPGSRRGAPDVTPIGGIHGDGIYGEGLGPRFGVDGEFLEGEFAPVYYEYDSSQIAPGERSKLEEVAVYMGQNPDVNLIVEGHCDERGSREYNLSLGERRALASRAYLVGLGVDGARIQTRSYGSERPVAFGHNEEAWRQNRRAEFVIAY
jgi:peptidoglycan-associated lipoprotein